MSHPQIDDLIAKLQDGNYSTRADAAWALGVVGDPGAVEPLIAALADSRAEVRQEAATALGKCRNKRAVKPLSESLNDISKYVRQYAILALGEIGDKRAIPALRERQSDHASLDSRRRAQRWYGKTVADVTGAILNILEQASSSPDKKRRMPKPSTVFISFAASDGTGEVKRLRHSLEEDFDLWWAEDIPPGMDRETAVRAAIDQTAAMVVVFTSGALRSKYVIAEWTYALDDRNIPVIPMLTAGVDLEQIPLVLQTVAPLDARVDHPKAMARLAETLKNILNA